MTQKSQKSQQVFLCKICDYITYKKTDFKKHLSTLKHQNSDNDDKNSDNFSPKVAKNHICDCGKIYKHRQGLSYHKKKCLIYNEEMSEGKITTTNSSGSEIKILTNLVLDVVKQNHELTSKIVDICKTGINTNQTNIISNSNINSNNKTFNLQFFLNETCKNAMNITDFVDSIKLQLNDLMEIGELGYVEGISKIIVKNLNNLDETERPIHCTDKKRETMYVKDEGEWNKEDDKKTKLKKAIIKIADKNIRLLPQFREKYPEYKNSSSKVSDKYDKMVVEVMTSDQDKNEKIIKNISKVTTIHG